MSGRIFSAIKVAAFTIVINKHRFFSRVVMCEPKFMDHHLTGIRESACAMLERIRSMNRSENT